jgi:hypothetical protein
MRETKRNNGISVCQFFLKKKKTNNIGSKTGKIAAQGYFDFFGMERNCKKLSVKCNQQKRKSEKREI